MIVVYGSALTSFTLAIASSRSKSLRPQGLLFKNDRFICTDSQKNIKTNKFTSIHYLNLICIIIFYSFSYFAVKTRYVLPTTCLKITADKVHVGNRQLASFDDVFLFYKIYFFRLQTNGSISTRSSMLITFL